MDLHISISRVRLIHKEPHSRVIRAFVVKICSWAMVEKLKGSTDLWVVTITIYLTLMIMEQANLYITTIFLFKQDSLAQENLSGVR